MLLLRSRLRCALRLVVLAPAPAAAADAVFAPTEACVAAAREDRLGAVLPRLGGAASEPGAVYRIKVCISFRVTRGGRRVRKRYLRPSVRSDTRNTAGVARRVHGCVCA